MPGPGADPGWRRGGWRPVERVVLGLALWLGSALPQAYGQSQHDVPSAEQIAERLNDAQQLLRLKNAPAASTVLADLLARGGDTLPAGHRGEALFWLGEALVAQGDVRTAERSFVEQVDLTTRAGGTGGALLGRALVRLVELAVELDSDERAAEWVDRIARLDPAERPENASYAVGRYLFARKRYAEARTMLGRVAEGGLYGLRARYHIGAAHVAEGALNEALTVFQGLTTAPVPTADDDRRVVELSHMAMGRIYHARGDGEKAHAAYLRISQKSDLFRDALYEAAWAAIRGQDYVRAEEALVLLVLAYRDAHESSYAAIESKMLLGQLLLRRGDPDGAMGWFAQARSDAAPIVEALRQRLTQRDPQQLASQLLDDPRAFSLDVLAPPAAQGLLRSDADVARFLRSQRELEALARSVAELQSYVAILDRRLMEAVRGGGDAAAVDALRVALYGERENLRLQTQALERARRDASQLGGALLTAAGEAVLKKFADVLLRAEAGELDVAWARKVRHSDQMAALTRDQKRDLRILDDEFSGPAPLQSGTVAVPALPPEAGADIGEDLRRYLETAEQYRGALYELGQANFKRRRSEVSSDYQARIGDEEKAERAARVVAIPQFEKFLERHRSHPRFVPDALFRLAELYFEQAGEEFAASVKKGGADATAGNPEYGPSIALYQRLLREYPGYRLNDGVHYLLGYCQGEMGHDAESRQALLGLVCSNKYKPLDTPAPWPGRKAGGDLYATCQPLRADSRFLAESWTRLGEQHFDRGELDAAVAAYGHVLPFRDSPYFDKALYKLAWTQYRSDRFAEAVRRFDELVVFADRASKGAESERATKSASALEKGSSLRGEAIQYLALSFAERDWDGDGKTDGDAGVPRLLRFYEHRLSEPHVREVLIRLGDLWFDRTEYARAADAYARAIERAPLSADNPKLQGRIAQAFDRQRSFEQALRAREALAREYAPGSAWYEANRGDAQAIETATELADAALMNAITNRHASAQDLRQRALKAKDGKLLAQARAEYRQAADSYATFLKQHPAAKNAYEYSYLLAESQYYAGDYAAAAGTYARVRDADLRGKHMEEAAYGAVKANEHVALAALSGAASTGPVAKSASGAAFDADDDVSRLLSDALPALPAVGKTAATPQAMAVPDEVAALQSAYDRYVALQPTHDRASLIAYKAAELDFRYLRFDRARTRFAAVLDRYCQSERAVDAGNAILVSHTIDGNLDQVESWTGRLQLKGCGGQGALAQQQRDSLRKLSDDVSFKKAEQLLDAKRYEAAASMFVALVDKNPKASSSDKALNNAAVAYENLGRPAQAAATYERLGREYPASPLVEEALFRAAVNHQRLLVFDKALAAYRALATLPRYAKSPHRRDALYNAALIADRDGDTPLGIQLWRAYEQDAGTSPDEAGDVAYRVAQLVERQTPGTTAAGSFRAAEEWEHVLRRHPVGAAGQADGAIDAKRVGRAVEAHFRIGRTRDTQRNPMDAATSYTTAVKLGARLAPGSEPAEYAAHSAFLLAERRLGELERQRITGSGAELEGAIKRFNDQVAAAVAEYEKILAFRRVTWTLAAYFRMGYVFELYAKALLSAPCPPEVKRLGEGACGLYRTKIEENVAQIEEQAIARYTVTMEQAGRLGVANNWTREARLRLSAYRPDRFPVLHEEHVAQGLSPGGVSAQASGSGASKTLAEARAAVEAGQSETALILGRQLLAENERSVPALLVLARANYHLGKIDLATAIVGMVQTIDEQNGEAQLLLGLLSLARPGSNPDGARIAATAAFKRATELDGNLGLAFYNLGAQYLLAKNYEQALLATQRAAALMPGGSGVQLNLAAALRGVGRHAEAADVWRRLSERDPQYADAYYNLGVLMLDAPSLPGFDVVGQRRAALQYFMRYQDLMPGRRDDQLEANIKEARTAIEREERRQQRKAGGGKP